MSSPPSNSKQHPRPPTTPKASSSSSSAIKTQISRIHNFNFDVPTASLSGHQRAVMQQAEEMRKQRQDAFTQVQSHIRSLHQNIQAAEYNLRPDEDSLYSSSGGNNNTSTSSASRRPSSAQQQKSGGKYKKENRLDVDKLLSHRDEIKSILQATEICAKLEAKRKDGYVSSSSSSDDDDDDDNNDDYEGEGTLDRTQTFSGDNSFNNSKNNNNKKKQHHRRIVPNVQTNAADGIDTRLVSNALKQVKRQEKIERARKLAEEQGQDFVEDDVSSVSSDEDDADHHHSDPEEDDDDQNILPRVQFAVDNKKLNSGFSKDKSSSSTAAGITSPSHLKKMQDEIDSFRDEFGLSSIRKEISFQTPISPPSSSKNKHPTHSHHLHHGTNLEDEEKDEDDDEDDEDDEEEKRIEKDIEGFSHAQVKARFTQPVQETLDFFAESCERVQHDISSTLLDPALRVEVAQGKYFVIGRQYADIAGRMISGIDACRAFAEKSLHLLQPSLKHVGTAQIQEQIQALSGGSAAAEQQRQQQQQQQEQSKKTSPGRKGSPPPASVSTASTVLAAEQQALEVARLVEKEKTRVSTARQLSKQLLGIVGGLNRCDRDARDLLDDLSQRDTLMAAERAKMNVAKEECTAVSNLRDELKSELWLHRASNRMRAAVRRKAERIREKKAAAAAARAAAAEAAGKGGGQHQNDQKDPRQVAEEDAIRSRNPVPMGIGIPAVSEIAGTRIAGPMTIVHIALDRYAEMWTTAPAAATKTIQMYREAIHASLWYAARISLDYAKRDAFETAREETIQRFAETNEPFTEDDERQIKPKPLAPIVDMFAQHVMKQTKSTSQLIALTGVHHAQHLKVHGHRASSLIGSGGVDLGDGEHTFSPLEWAKRLPDDQSHNPSHPANEDYEDSEEIQSAATIGGAGSNRKRKKKIKKRGDSPFAFPPKTPGVFCHDAYPFRSLLGLPGEDPQSFMNIGPAPVTLVAEGDGNVPGSGDGGYYLVAFADPNVAMKWMCGVQFLLSQLPWTDAILNAEIPSQREASGKEKVFPMLSRFDSSIRERLAQAEQKMANQQSSSSASSSSSSSTTSAATAAASGGFGMTGNNAASMSMSNLFTSTTTNAFGAAAATSEGGANTQQQKQQDALLTQTSHGLLSSQSSSSDQIEEDAAFIAFSRRFGLQQEESGGPGSHEFDAEPWKQIATLLSRQWGCGDQRYPGILFRGPLVRIGAHVGTVPFDEVSHYNPAKLAPFFLDPCRKSATIPTASSTVAKAAWLCHQARGGEILVSDELSQYVETTLKREAIFHRRVPIPAMARDLFTNTSAASNETNKVHVGQGSAAAAAAAAMNSPRRPFKRRGSFGASSSSSPGSPSSPPPPSSPSRGTGGLAPSSPLSGGKNSFSRSGNLDVSVVNTARENQRHRHQMEYQQQLHARPGQSNPLAATISASAAESDECAMQLFPPMLLERGLILGIPSSITARSSSYIARVTCFNPNWWIWFNPNPHPVILRRADLRENDLRSAPPLLELTGWTHAETITLQREEIRRCAGIVENSKRVAASALRQQRTAMQISAVSETKMMLEHDQSPLQEAVGILRTQNADTTWRGFSNWLVKWNLAFDNEIKPEMMNILPPGAAGASSSSAPTPTPLGAGSHGDGKRRKSSSGSFSGSASFLASFRYGSFSARKQHNDYEQANPVTPFVLSNVILQAVTHRLRMIRDLEKKFTTKGEPILDESPFGVWFKKMETSLPSNASDTSAFHGFILQLISRAVDGLYEECFHLVMKRELFTNSATHFDALETASDGTPEVTRPDLVHQRFCSEIMKCVFHLDSIFKLPVLLLPSRAVCIFAATRPANTTINPPSVLDWNTFAHNFVTSNWQKFVTEFQKCYPSSDVSIAAKVADAININTVAVTAVLDDEDCHHPHHPHSGSAGGMLSATSATTVAGFQSQGLSQNSTTSSSQPHHHLHHSHHSHGQQTTSTTTAKHRWLLPVSIWCRRKLTGTASYHTLGGHVAPFDELMNAIRDPCIRMWIRYTTQIAVSPFAKRAFLGGSANNDPFGSFTFRNSFVAPGSSSTSSPPSVSASQTQVPQQKLHPSLLDASISPSASVSILPSTSENNNNNQQQQQNAAAAATPYMFEVAGYEISDFDLALEKLSPEQKKANCAFRWWTHVRYGQSRMAQFNVLEIRNPALENRSTLVHLASGIEFMRRRCELPDHPMSLSASAFSPPDQNQPGTGTSSETPGLSWNQLFHPLLGVGIDYDPSLEGGISRVAIIQPTSQTLHDRLVKDFVNPIEFDTSSNSVFQRRKREFLRMAMSLSQLHSFGLFHGDLRPDNIFVEEDIGSGNVDNARVRYRLGNMLFVPSLVHEALKSHRPLYRRPHLNNNQSKSNSNIKKKTEGDDEDNNNNNNKEGEPEEEEDAKWGYISPELLFHIAHSDSDPFTPQQLAKCDMFSFGVLLLTAMSGGYDHPFQDLLRRVNLEQEKKMIEREFKEQEEKEIERERARMKAQKMARELEKVGEKKKKKKMNDKKRNNKNKKKQKEEGEEEEEEGENKQDDDDEDANNNDEEEEEEEEQEEEVIGGNDDDDDGEGGEDSVAAVVAAARREMLASSSSAASFNPEEAAGAAAAGISAPKTALELQIIAEAKAKALEKRMLTSTAASAYQVVHRASDSSDRLVMLSSLRWLRFAIFNNLKRTRAEPTVRENLAAKRREEKEDQDMTEAQAARGFSGAASFAFAIKRLVSRGRRGGGFKLEKTDSDRATAGLLLIDLVMKLLVADPKKRLTADQVCQHPFFADVMVSEYSSLPVPSQACTFELKPNLFFQKLVSNQQQQQQQEEGAEKEGESSSASASSPAFLTQQRSQSPAPTTATSSSAAAAASGTTTTTTTPPKPTSASSAAAEEGEGEKKQKSRLAILREQRDREKAEAILKSKVCAVLTPANTDSGEEAGSALRSFIKSAELQLLRMRGKAAGKYFGANMEDYEIKWNITLDDSLIEMPTKKYPEGSAYLPHGSSSSSKTGGGGGGDNNNMSKYDPFASLGNVLAASSGSPTSSPPSPSFAQPASSAVADSESSSSMSDSSDEEDEKSGASGSDGEKTAGSLGGKKRRRKHRRQQQRSRRPLHFDVRISPAASETMWRAWRQQRRTAVQLLDSKMEAVLRKAYDLKEFSQEGPETEQQQQTNKKEDVASKI